MFANGRYELTSKQSVCFLGEYEGIIQKHIKATPHKARASRFARILLAYFPSDCTSFVRCCLKSKLIA